MVSPGFLILLLSNISDARRTVSKKVPCTIPSVFAPYYLSADLKFHYSCANR